MKEQTVILGGRSGTSLVRGVLKYGCNLATWGQRYDEAPIRMQVFASWPNVDTVWWSRDWEVAKLPVFFLVLDEIEKKFHPKYLYLKRDLTSRVKSHRSLHWDDLLKERVNDEMKRAMGLTDENDAARFSREWFEWYDREVDEHLKTVPPSRKLVVEFDDLMSDYHDVMREIFEFVGVKPIDDALLDAFRERRWQLTSRPTNEWIEKEWKPR